MKHVFPYPFVTVLSLLGWLVLNDSLAIAHWLLGLAAGVLAGVAYALLQPPAQRRRLPIVTVARLLGAVLLDIARSNVAVARIVLRLSGRSRKAGFLHIPLELRHPAGLALLACIVTATPGTSWARHDAQAGVLVLHVLDLVDEEAWVRQFKHSYERRLMEIFE